jgi:hypothetical protein
MSRHSKNSSCKSYFTSSERSKLKGKEWGTQQIRLNNDNILNFDYCCLCLQPSVKPVITYLIFIIFIK